MDFQDIVTDLHVLAALILSSPLVGTWTAAAQLLALEELPDVPLDITTLSRDPAVGETYAADPLVWHGPFERATLEAVERGVQAVLSGPNVGDLPLMWIHGEDVLADVTEFVRAHVASR
jgi:alpha-beta hydrolase superfamily lysophospholipase